jgi:hypothetical protein
MKSFLAGLFCLVCITNLNAQTTDTSSFSVLIGGTIRVGGTIKGSLKSWPNGLHEHHFNYYLNNRGMLDSIRTIVQTNLEGLLVSLKAHNYKKLYEESFEIAGDSAIWIINGIKKTKAFHKQWYNASEVPGLTELQLRWLLKQPGQKGNLLPEGNIRTNDPQLKTIAYQGQSVNLKLLPLYTNTEPLPSYVWLTSDLRFFASTDGWTSIIKEGYESWIDTLWAIQEEANLNYYRQQMKQYATDIPAHLFITHANVFQSPSGTVAKDMTVEVILGIVTAIYPASKNNKIKGGTVIDAKGKFLMPGLWDMHGHFDKSEGIWYVAGGVTHVRDMGNRASIVADKRKIASNQIIGPEISFISGRIDLKGPNQASSGKFAYSLSEALDAIKQYHQLGYNQIKIYGSIKPEWVAPMCAQAHQLGMRVCGHIPYQVTAEQAIKDGFDELTHNLFLFKDFLSKNFDAPFVTRFRLIGDSARTVDLKSQPVQAFIRQMKENNIVVDPTLNIYAQFFQDFKGDTADMFKPIVSWLPDDKRHNLAKATFFGSNDKKEAYRASYQKMLELVKLLYDNGIMLVAGTDGGAAIALQHELALYVQAGIPANEVLKIATYNAAKDCGLENKYGEIKAGRAADFILIDGDPTQNISDIRRVEWVIKNGQRYSPKQLLASQGWKYYY